MRRRLAHSVAASLPTAALFTMTAILGGATTIYDASFGSSDAAAPTPDQISAELWQKDPVPGWTPMSERPADYFAATLLVVTQRGERIVLDYDAAHARNSNQTTHDDVWVIAYR